MKISSSDLINLPVYTQSNKHLGRVASFEINTDTGQVENYLVKTGLIQGLWHEQLIINQRQVVSISQEKMVVEDNVLKQPETELKGAKFAAPATK